VQTKAGDDRRRLILEHARGTGHIEVAEIATRLDVAAETVRRDLKVLEEHGLVRRTHGGAYPTDEAWGQLIYPICDPVFKTYTGTPVEDRTDIDYLFLVPTSDRWAGGDRHVTCLIRSLDGSPLRHSYRASG